MGFLRTQRKTEDRISKIDERSIELGQELARRQKEISDRKTAIAGYLGELALEANSEVEANLKSTKKSLEKLEESATDLLAQIEYLKMEKDKLTLELHRSKIRELPEKAEAEAKAFNKLLQNAISAAEVLRGVYDGLKIHERNFHSLLKDREYSLDQLHEIVPLNLQTSLGELAQVGAPYAQSISLSDQFDGNFLNQLLYYKQKLAEFKDFQEKNPNYLEDARLEEAKSEEKRKQDQFSPFIEGFSNIR